MDYVLDERSSRQRFYRTLKNIAAQSQIIATSSKRLDYMLTFF